jgi:dTMP kinase
MSNNKSPLFITFEGIEGCGKSTQSRLAFDVLSKSFDCIHTREPGGTPVADKIRAVLLDPNNKEIDPLTELFLYNASRIEHIKKVIIPALDEGKIVLCDRYFDSSLAYQGAARSLPLETLFKIHEIATENLFPHITFLLDLPAKVGISRVKSRKSASGKAHILDRIELENIDFHEKVRKAYINLKNQFPDRIIEIDATLPEKEIHTTIIDTILHLSL